MFVCLGPINLSPLQIPWDSGMGPREWPNELSGISEKGRQNQQQRVYLFVGKLIALTVDIWLEGGELSRDEE